MRKNIYAIGILILCVALAFSGCTDNGEDNGNGNGTDFVEQASSLRFTVEATTTEGHGTLTWSAKNIGTENLKLMMEGTMDGEEFGNILNGETRWMWYLEDGEWILNEIPEESWNTFWDVWKQTFEGYRSSLSSWTGGEYTYTDGQGNTVRIYNVQINPNLPDPLFAP